MEITKLKDKDILRMADNNILTDDRDFNLNKYNPKGRMGVKIMNEYPGGIFDTEVFGSAYRDKCMCGSTTQLGKTCNYCHTHLNSEVEEYVKFGAIKSPIYFIFSTFVEGLNVYLKKVFKSTPKLSQDDLYLKTFMYDEVNDALKISNSTDVTDLSIEGLIKIFSTYKPSYLDDLFMYVHKYILVLPVSVRPWAYTYKPWLGSMTLDLSEMNYKYKTLIYICNTQFPAINFMSMNFEDMRYTLASFRLGISKVAESINGLVRSSKESSIRSGYSVRVPNSSRLTAVADASLDIDEVSIPVSVIFEIFKVRINNWFINELKLSEVEIADLMLSDRSKIRELVDEYLKTNTLYVMINRAPTLYKLSQLVFKVKVNKGNYLGYTLMATTPLNLDFDGDTVAVYQVPQHLEHTITDMLPSNLLRYGKNDKEVIVPKQETLMGLMVATKLDKDRSKDIVVNSPEKLDDLYDEGKFDSNDIITIGNEPITYGRFKLSKITGLTIDYEINSSNISEFITEIKNMPNFIDIMKELQEFCLKVATFENPVDLDLTNLKNKSKEDKSIEVDEILDNNSGIEILKQSSEVNKLTDSIKGSLKGNPTSINSIVNRQMINEYGNWEISSKSLIDSIPADEYVKLCTEARKVQQVKVNSVATAGYLARQLWTAMGPITFNNEIITNKRYLRVVVNTDCIRYKDGKEVRCKKGEIYELDSTLTTPGYVAYKNNITKNQSFKDGALIGTDFGMQISEGISQGILKLKHEGNYVGIDSNGLIVATENNTEVKFDDNFIYVNDKKFLKASDMKILDKNKSKYNKGEWIGTNGNLVSIDTNLYYVIKFLGALGSSDAQIKPKLKKNIYNLRGGIVSFVENKVVVDGVRYPIPSDSICLVYEGQRIEEGTKLFSGVLDYKDFLSKNKVSLDLAFKIFNNEIQSLVTINSLLIEFLYKAIVSIDEVNGVYMLTWKGVKNALVDHNQLLTDMTLGYINDKLSKFIASEKKEIELGGLMEVTYQFNNLMLANTLKVPELLKLNK